MLVGWLVLTLTACVNVGRIDDVDPPVAATAEEVGVDPSEDAGSTAGPELIEADCPEGLVGQVDCGFLLVPENRDDRTSQLLEVAWVRLPAVDDAASQPDLLLVPDGPGQGGIAEAEQWLDSSLRADRGIILFDPRGAGRSFPSLDCGQPPRPGSLPLDLVEDCRAQLVAAGVDLQAFDTAAIASDVAALIGALALDRVDLLAVGSGARVAVTLLRSTDAPVRAVVLDSPVPQGVDTYAERPRNAQAAVNRLLDECVQTDSCNRRFGDMREQVQQMVLSLDQSAAQEAVDVVTGNDLVVAAIAAMRGEDGPAAVPSALDRAVDGDPERALELLQSAAMAGAAVPTSLFSEGLRLSTECRDSVPFSDVAQDVEGLTPIGRAIADDVNQLLAACGIWQVGEGERPSVQTVGRTVDALILTGEYDPLSPSSYAAAAAAQLPGAVVVQVNGAGHRVHDIDACTLGITGDFLDNPAQPVDTECARSDSVDFDLS